ncbi:MAG TPA: RNase adapter RapZ [Candidatus Scatomorpha merdipullorum]|uniref:RNase adapter RapZ n=1 Tax=Candidatus Scatomorpha merdipullorum TaxID=2840927 RepID=A0A9D1FDN8_9FIRM|nr:RNase adapter RapZ [Candidatus Scatomorpha merdipullorum]
MEFLIISGMSGAGKSQAADILEDMDYYCVDNLPLALLGRFAELCLASRGRYERVALVTDVRERESIAGLLPALDGLWGMGLDYRIMFMEADVPTIVRRYKSSRRPHPMQEPGGSLEDAVRREVSALASVRERADYIINTTGLSSAMLQSRIRELLSRTEKRFSITVTAFGYKYGLPIDADLVFDVRFLPNPYYISELRPLSGLDDKVASFILERDEAREFMDRLASLLDFIIPLYAEEGRYTLHIAVGCTGGRHRSVAVANALAKRLAGRRENVTAAFRDIEKG